MNPDFGYKHLTGLAWLLGLIAIVMTVLLVMQVMKQQLELDREQQAGSK